MKEILRKAKFIIFFAMSSYFVIKCLCWYDCQRALVDKSGVLPVGIIPTRFSMLSITCGINKRPAGGRSSEM
jgi:hypothetical protein